MLLKKFSAMLGAAALIGLFHSAVLPAGAQQAPPANPLQGFNLPPALFFGFAGQASGGVDPTHSAAMQLLQRIDVRNEIGLDLKQQNALDDLRTKSQQEFQTTLQTNIQESMKALQNVPQDQQQGQIQNRMDQFATTIQSFQGDLDKRTEAILRPKQVTRLHELDLRWRGPLALCDPTVAATLKLTPDQTNKVNPLVKEYMDGQQKAMTQVMTPALAPNGNGQDGGAATPQERMLQMQKKMYDAMHSKEMEKAKTEIEAKLLDLLTPAQKDQWTSMKGAKFTFRKTEVP
ncbi:MAG: Small-conductance mechanosensitive channel [Chthonomonadaceae bacterium]|nr:Small-conductance mechanosensitive channel [Chthonomonadaceae bacterium]